MENIPYLYNNEEFVDITKRYNFLYYFVEDSRIQHVILSGLYFGITIKTGNKLNVNFDSVSNVNNEKYAYYALSYPIQLYENFAFTNDELMGILDFLIDRYDEESLNMQDYSEVENLKLNYVYRKMIYEIQEDQNNMLQAQNKVNELNDILDTLE
jgi:hypothetical protein